MGFAVKKWSVNMPMPICPRRSLRKNPNLMKHIMRGNINNNINCILINIVEFEFALKSLTGNPVSSMSTKKVSDGTNAFFEELQGMNPLNLCKRHTLKPKERGLPNFH